MSFLTYTEAETALKNRTILSFQGLQYDVVLLALLDAEKTLTSTPFALVATVRGDSIEKPLSLYPVAIDLSRKECLGSHGQWPVALPTFDEAELSEIALSVLRPDL